jgi:FAD/FMN-containing dehydrogenase
MNDVRHDFRLNGVDFIYGTIRLIEAESETALPWARENYACVIFNLHIDHHREEVARVADHFRRLIDLSLRHGGSYFLTYHRFASAAQVEAAHPAIRQFLATKQRLDPEGVFQSDWYRHLSGLFK